MTRLLALVCACAVPLSACSDRSDQSAEQPTPDAELVNSPAAVAKPTPTLAEGMGYEIPPALRGRFGLVPADCTSDRDDEKGLVTIGEKDMRFYESVAVLNDWKSVSGAQLHGTFAYSGEGMEWTRDVSLETRDGGKTLVMEEFGDDAPKGPRSYTRCPA